jgi:hypothetical protein
VPAAWLMMWGVNRVRVQGNHGELIANPTPRHLPDERNYWRYADLSLDAALRPSMMGLENLA